MRARDALDESDEHPSHFLRRRRLIPKPRVAAQRRTLGSGPRWLPYAGGVLQNGGMATCRSWPFVKPLRGIWYTHRLPRVRRCAATLGCGVQPLRGKEIDSQRK